MRRLQRLLQAYLTAEPAELVADLAVLLLIAGSAAIWGWQWALFAAGLVLFVVSSGLLKAIVGRIAK